MGRIFLYAILVWIAYFLVKKVAKTFFSASVPQDRHSGAVSDAELIQDPQCGAYFMKQKGIKGIVDGKVIHFCSEQCYGRYLKRHRQT
jgi:YHS domain-containing protein